ncbi:MAG TPA: DUF4350 domain-containing protein [Pirellulales bacterium]|nr:DUF4350 domain-containing protein [Pirellulales bacterium]
MSRSLAECARLSIVLLGVLLVAQLGCARREGDDSLQGDYGQNHGERFSASVNGLTVLADMLTEAGDTVSTREELSPVLQEEADAIIWAPDDFAVPDPDTCQKIDDWLRAKENRTFVYIGRDFDARPVYWQQIVAQAAPADREKYQKELDQSKAWFTLDRTAVPQSARCEWFSIDGTAPHRDVRSLDGPWADGIDASKVAIELNSRLIPSDDAKNLLACGDAAGDMLVSEQSFDVLAPKIRWLAGTHTSNLLLVANGSFLFNEPLVNHEHRKLAGQLIEAVGKAKHVVILDSQNHRPVAFDSDNGGGNNDNPPPEQPPQSMLDIFNVWPLSAILVQWGVLIVALCFAKWPIFGPPRDPPPPPASDFGRHVDALGAAMAVTGDAEYAKSRVQQYRQMRDIAGSRAINRTNVKKQS